MEPKQEDWRPLYEAAKRVKEMAPWRWMEETDIFAVHDPESGELFFVSVMGMLEQHFGISAYRGTEGLYGFWSMQEDEEKDDISAMESLLTTPQIQASFEDRDELDKEDRALIKKLGLSFRGRQAWPLFRSIRPGFFPWFLDDKEVRLLTLVLEQLLEVAPRLRERQDLLPPPETEQYLVRLPQRGQDGQLKWMDEIREVTPRPMEFEILIETDTLDSLKDLPRAGSIVQMDLSLVPTKFQEQRDQRPGCTYLMLMADESSGMVLHVDMLQVHDSLIALWRHIPTLVMNVLTKVGFIPKEIKVSSPLLRNLTLLIAQNLDMRLTLTRDLSAVDTFKREMLQRFM